MKHLYLILITSLLVFDVRAQNVGIGTNVPESSAQLDVYSTTKGFLPPRVTIAQRKAIGNPAIGLVVFCTECDELEVYNGTTWKNMIGAAACVTATLPNITICNQVWMQKNLDVDHYSNGDPILQVTDPTIWAGLTTGAWCWYNNDSATYGATYGRLYNWYAVNDPRGLAPTGWRIPSDADWISLLNCAGGAEIAGGNLKSTSLWNAPNTAATNSSGFSGLPAGYRYNTGVFEGQGSYSYLWTSTSYSTESAVYYSLFSNVANSNRLIWYKTDGFSVRCIRK